MSIKLSDILHSRPVVKPTIYGYITPDIPNHDGYIKIGYTDKDDVEIRIKEQLRTVATSHKTLINDESAMRSDGTCFTDKDVHKLLKHKGFQMFDFGDRSNEWFKCSEKDVRQAIMEVREGRRYEGNRYLNFKMRDEQKAAVIKTKHYFKKAKEEDPNSKPKYLWNAKMRFGKTFAAYKLAKEMNMKRILILTFKPAVESAWQDDLLHHIDFEEWQFVSDKEAKYDQSTLDAKYAECDKSKPIVVFGSFQNLLGTNDVGGIKAKNEFIHIEQWDLVIFDEYHFGAWRDNAKNLFINPDEDDSDFDIEKYQKEESGNAINETWLPIKTSYYLYLSGTPFRALNSGEFLEDQIFNWTYSDEQKAKEEWTPKHKGEVNPYEALPKMLMLTYKIPDSITKVAVNEGYDGFDINEFFKAKSPDDNVENARFIYEDEVQKWIKLIQGNYNPIDGLKLGNDKPPMPFSDVTLLQVLSHTLWFLPNVASCYAMYNLLHQKQNTFFRDYKIIVCAGVKAGIGIAALEGVQRIMKNPLNTKTITLTCGKLTTGVTVRPWTGVFMLRNLKSPETYFQTAFRVQSPWEITDDKGKKQIMKKECYIFDFALERALRQVTDYSCRLKVGDTSPEQKVKEFINFLPILAFDGSSMNEISAKDVLDITFAGTSATLLAKRWQTALLVHVDNDTLKKLSNNPVAMKALMKIEGFRSLNKDIETIINRSQAIKKAKRNSDSNLTNKQKKELTEEEKKIKSLRKQVQEKLLKLASRIPAFMYLTDYREQTIKDVITQTEPKLFNKVTGLNVNDFDILCSIGLFDPEKMNQGIFGFRQYENASLVYTGIDMHEGEDVGGWDTVLTRKEYDELYNKQQATMTDLKEIILNGIPNDTERAKVTSDITRNDKSISTSPQLTSSKDDIDWESLDVEGRIVYHKKFGEGTVTKKLSNSHIRVKFNAVEKTFIFPHAFKEGYLRIIE